MYYLSQAWCCPGSKYETTALYKFMKSKLSQIFVITAALITTIVFVLNFGQKANPFYGDALGYYIYLPSTFIYHNSKAIYELPADEGISPHILEGVAGMRNNYPQSKNGYTVNQYTYGVAFFELPFFLIAHMYERATNKEANGFSESYRTAVRVSGWFYVLLGLWILYRTLKIYFQSAVAVYTTVLIFLGTNLFWFACYQPGMAHIPVFFLFALLILLTIKIHDRPRIILFFAAGLTAGFITIIRPSDILCLLIPLLYGVTGRAAIKQKILFLKSNLKGLIFFSLAFGIALLPQLLYWKELTGSFVFYSYGSQSFNWLKPRIFDGLFSFYNGWLAYSPIMIFSIAGLIFYKKIKSWMLCVAILLPAYIYVIYSWYCYNYINGLGSRPMIHMYPLLVLPFAAFISYIIQKKLIARAIVMMVLFFFISVNISFSIQKINGILNTEEANFNFVRSTLFKTHLDYNDLVTFDMAEIQPRPGTAEKIATLACDNFEDSTTEGFTKDPTGKSKFVYRMGNEEYLPSGLKIVYNAKVFNGAKWLRASGRFMYPNAPDYYKHLLVLNASHGDENLFWKAAKIENKIGIADSTCHHKNLTLDHFEINKWGTVYFYIKIPSAIADGDEISLFVWNIGKRELFLDDLCIDIYR